MGWVTAFFTSVTAVCFALAAILFLCGALWAALGWSRRSKRLQITPALRTLRLVIGGGCLVLGLCFGWLSFTYAWLNNSRAHASTQFSVVPAGSGSAEAPVSAAAQSAP